MHYVCLSVFILFILSVCVKSKNGYAWYSSVADGLGLLVRSLPTCSPPSFLFTGIYVCCTDVTVADVLQSIPLKTEK